jgi:regulator of replication initiation timing
MNDVDVSLRELRDLEDRRIADEESARNAELAARAAEQAARAAAEEAAMLARRRQLEEDAIRVREAEARARAEALVRIEADRLASEVELRRAELAVRRPRWMIGLAAGLAAITLLTGGMALHARSENQLRAAELRDAHTQIDEATRRLEEARREESELRRDVATYREELEKLRTAAAELQKRLAEATRKARPEETKKPRPPQPPSQNQNVNTIQVCTDKVLCD